MSSNWRYDLGEGLSEASTISQWIPVIGTLGGALLGFLASFFTALFTKSKESREQREERDRRRIERIYELLIVISQENGSQLHQAINWIHYGIPVKVETIEGIPPLVELEMLVSLYFEELEPNRNELMRVVQKFGKRYVEFRSEDYRDKEKSHKQHAASEFVAMNFGVDEKIEAFKLKISEVVKS